MRFEKINFISLRIFFGRQKVLFHEKKNLMILLNNLLRLFFSPDTNRFHFIFLSIFKFENENQKKNISNLLNMFHDIIRLKFLYIFHHIIENNLMKADDFDLDFELYLLLSHDNI